MYETRLVKVVKEDEEYITKDYIEKKSYKKLVNKKFRKIYDDLLDVIFKLTGSEPRVLSYLLKNCCKNNFIKISYKDLSMKLNLSTDSIKKIMRRLQKLNIVKNVGGIIYVNPFMYVKHGSQAELLQIEYMPLFKEGLI